METYAYLTACNKIFERGFFCKKPVFDELSPVLQNIDTGYQYFQSWLDSIKSHNPYLTLGDKKSPFLSWQTFYLLRICVFGLRGLISDFSNYHDGGYYLVLSRITGSAVESLFSQIKYSAGGKLSAVNYPSACNSVRLAADISSSHTGNSDYRDEHLNL